MELLSQAHIDGVSLLHAFGILLFCGIEMLIQDALWSAGTKAIADGKRLQGALCNTIGDGLAKATGILTISLVAHSLSRSTEVAQVVGDMSGAFLGVFAGGQLTTLLDSLFEHWHATPLKKRAYF